MKAAKKNRWKCITYAALLGILSFTSLCDAAQENKVYMQPPLWSHHIPGKVTSIAALNDSILIGGENGLYMLDYQKNNPWFLETSGSVSSISLLGGKIVETSTDGFMKLVNNQGKIVWDRNVPGYVGYADAVDSDKGGILCGSMDGYVYMFDPNGTYEWKHLIGSYVTDAKLLPDRAIAVSDRQTYILDRAGKVMLNLNINGYVRAAKITGNYIIIGLSNGALDVYDLGGNLIWGYQTGENITQVMGEKNVTAGTREGHVFHLSADGKLLWRLNMSDSVTALKEGNGIIVVGTQDQKASVYTEKGALRWYYETDGRPTAIDINGPHIISGSTTGWVYYTKLPTKDTTASLMVSFAIMAIVGGSLLMVSRSWR